MSRGWRCTGGKIRRLPPGLLAVDFTAMAHAENPHGVQHPVIAHSQTEGTSCYCVGNSRWCTAVPCLARAGGYLIRCLDESRFASAANKYRSGLSLHSRPHRSVLCTSKKVNRRATAARFCYRMSLGCLCCEPLDPAGLRLSFGGDPLCGL